jgi:hypothetical protein
LTLREAAGKLLAEVGELRFQPEIRALIGHTNWQILHDRAAAVELALADAAPCAEPTGDDALLQRLRNPLLGRVYGIAAQRTYNEAASVIERLQAELQEARKTPTRSSG